MEIGRLAARAVIGGLFIGHGTQKLFGWFGGPGLSGTEQMMGALEMRPTKANAIAAGVSEAAGGTLLVLGAATPVAAASLIGTMATAIHKVHGPTDRGSRKAAGSTTPSSSLHSRR
jgi:putative oxidoreductase